MKECEESLSHVEQILFIVDGNVLLSCVIHTVLLGVRESGGLRGHFFAILCFEVAAFAAAMPSSGS